MKLIKFLLLFLIVMVFGWYSLRYYHSFRKHQKFYLVDKFNAFPKIQAIEGTQAYMDAHDNHFPDADRWEDEIQPYWHGKEPFRMILYSDHGEKMHRLAMNKTLSGRSFASLEHPDQTVMYYETTSINKNANGLPHQSPGLHHDDGMVQVVICADDRDEEEEWGCGPVRFKLKH